jgi:sterol desaturase/sphingolipid hydroxylase (fatty acid hydroxylase superfamily)
VQAFWERLYASVIAPLDSLVSPQSAFNGIFLISTLLFCVLVYVFRTGRVLRLLSLRRVLFPRRIFLHPSAKLDYKYYVVAAFMRVGVLGSMVISSTAVAGLSLFALEKLFGPPAHISAPLYVVLPIVTISQIVLFDLGYWIAHRLMHEIPLLWEFHKPHHAAEVLTPATSARSHPFDDLLQTNFTAGTLGLGYGVLAYIFGESQPLRLLEINVIFFVYFATIFHLRHSHIWLPIRGWLGHIIQSPAHHHIHHSNDPRHYGKNLGFCLSIWDWLFGTLYVPNKREALEFGLGKESRDFASVTDLLLTPFRKAWGLIAGRPERASVPAQVMAKPHET